jgi:hypothetical protein
MGGRLFPQRAKRPFGSCRGRRAVEGGGGTMRKRRAPGRLRARPALPERRLSLENLTRGRGAGPGPVSIRITSENWRLVARPGPRETRLRYDRGWVRQPSRSRM